MVSLAVLGLIAGLTVPSLINSVQLSRRKAIFKEDVQILSEIAHAGLLNGDFDNLESWNTVSRNDIKSITGYISSKLNSTKQCLTGDSTSSGCVANDPTSPWLGSTADNNFNARWVLPNGSKIKFYNINAMYDPTGTML